MRIWLALFTIFFLFISPVCAANLLPEDLVVTGTDRLSYQSEPYTFHSLTVEKGGKLIIDPGVRVYLEPGATIAVKGELESTGTAARHILFAPLNPFAPWHGLVAEYSDQPLDFTYTDFVGFTAPIKLQRTALTVQHCSFTDGTRNVLELGVAGLNFSGLTELNGLSFTNHLQGTDMQDEGVQLFGNFQQILVSDIRFTDTRLLQPSPYTLGILVDGSYTGLNAVAVNYGIPCGSRIRNHLAGKHTELVVNPQSCNTSLIPTVFVPGYGTSVNLKKLSNSSSENINLSGWRFLKGLTPAYFSFLDSLKSAGITYETAYYDWRLPSAVAATSYLQPIIDRAKQRSGSVYVNIVAHSFGGLVARSYIQNPSYRGDVYSLVELGTPNQGAAKAYSVWEAGVLPADWRAFAAIFRLYGYQQRKRKLSALEVIHQYFPSAEELLPVYPAIFYQNTPQDPTTFTYKNSTLLSLNATIGNLKKRVLITTVYSFSEATEEHIFTRGPSGKTTVSWPDGEPLSTQPALEKVGDGTVPSQSAVISGSQEIVVQGEHANLPAIAAKSVLHLLYPTAPPPNTASAPAQSYTLFVFDCPVTVQITLPNGAVVDSEAPANSDEVEESDDMLWLLLPTLSGSYDIHITAKATTEVRSWVDSGPIQVFILQQGQAVVGQYAAMAEKLTYPNSPAEVSPQSPSQAPKASLSTNATGEEMSASTNFPFFSPWHLPYLFLFSSAYLAATFPTPVPALPAPNFLPPSSSLPLPTVTPLPTKSSHKEVGIEAIGGIGVLVALILFVRRRK